MNNFMNNFSFGGMSANNTFLPRTEITKVNGRPGAEKRLSLMPPDSSDLFLDETAAIIWAARKDSTGTPSLDPYDIKPHIEKPPVDFEAIEKRLTKLEELYYERKSNSGSAEPKPADNAEAAAE